MSWITVTLADLKDAKVSALIEACRTAALGIGQTDPIPNIITDAILRIRAEVASNTANVLDPDPTTVPPELKALAARMIVRAAMSRIKRPLSHDEETEQTNDLHYLERIAEGKVKIGGEETGEVQSGGAIELASTPTRIATRETLSGL